MARAVEKQLPSFAAPKHLISIMLMCESIHADQIVYGDGLDLSSSAPTTPVGPDLPPVRAAQLRVARGRSDHQRLTPASGAFWPPPSVVLNFPPQEAKAAEPATIIGDSMTTRVLITEDEPNIVESLTFILQRAGYEVSSVADGEAAVRRLRSDPPDIMILDVMLPKLNGFDVLKLIKTDPRPELTAGLVLTAKGQAHDRQLAEEIGADAFITKPFSNRDIIEQIGRLCPA